MALETALDPKPAATTGMAVAPPDGRMNIHFRRDQSNAFYRSVRHKCRTYLRETGQNRYGGWRLAGKGIVLAAAGVTFYALAVSGRFATVPTLIFACLFGLSSLLFAVNIGHEAAHETAVRSRLGNRILQFIAFAPLGADATLWRLRHVRSHHVSPNVSGYDVDVGENGFVRLSPQQRWHWYNRYQHIYTPLVFWMVDLHAVFFHDFKYILGGRMANVSFSRKDPLLVGEFLAQKLVFVAILFAVPYLLLGRPWWHILVGALVVTFVNSIVFVYLLIGTHHCEETSYPEATDVGSMAHGWAYHQLATSMDWSPLSRVANFIAGGANAHAAHHLFPNVSHVHYIPITRIIQAEVEKFGMPYNQTVLTKMIASHTRHLKTLGQPPVSQPQNA